MKTVRLLIVVIGGSILSAAVCGRCGAGSSVSNRTVAPIFEASRGTDFSFGGLVGERIKANLENCLLAVPASNPSMLQMFRDRDRTPARDLVPWAGEFAGKYLISAVQALRMTKDARLRAHLGRFVTELIATQDADGYLGPFPRDRRMTGKGLWDLWGQYHVMLGLHLWHRETGDEPALAACRRCADLFCRTFLDSTQRVLHAGSEEMNESSVHIFCLLYEATGEPRYLRMVREIEKDWEAAPSGDYVRTALAGKAFHQTPKPRWESLHSIQAIAELYFITGDEKYRKAFEQIWWSIVEYDRHNTGGFSSGEQATGNPYDPRAIETCCTLAWSAITVDMLRMTGDSRAADELELSFFNGVLGAQSPEGRWWTYNTPMDGERKASAHDIVFQARAGSPELNCCSVNGPRGLGMLSEWAVMTSRDGIIMNYFGRSEFAVRTPAGRKVRLRQVTDYPIRGKIIVNIVPERAERFALHLRIPGWSHRSTAKVNGLPSAEVRSGKYLVLNREWKRGDEVELALDMSPHFWVGERESRGKASAYWGPVLLAYDPRFDRYDPTQLPELDFESPLQLIAVTTTAPKPVLLVKCVSREGSEITLCDFATAGMAGNRYLSWLPARSPAPVAFTRENPLRVTRP